MPPPPVLDTVPMPIASKSSANSPQQTADATAVLQLADAIDAWDALYLLEIQEHFDGIKKHAIVSLNPAPDVAKHGIIKRHLDDLWSGVEQILARQFSDILDKAFQKWPSENG